MEKKEIQILKDKIDRESKIINLVNQEMNHRDGGNLWFLVLIFFGILIGFFLGRI
jgi:uncharacterized Rmd1/YagE family protein